MRRLVMPFFIFCFVVALSKTTIAGEQAGVTSASSDHLWTLISAIIGFVLGGFSDKFKDMIWGAKLSASFTLDDGAHAVIGSYGSYQCIYARVSVENRGLSRADKCQVKVEQFIENRWKDLNIIDPSKLKLASTNSSPFDPMALPPKIKFFFDVFRYIDAPIGSELAAFEMCDEIKAFGNPNPGSRYRLTIVVTGEKVRPQTIFLEFDHGLPWSDYTKGLKSSIFKT